jgi:membrane protein DedA with SNARE-associated domain
VSLREIVAGYGYYAVFLGSVMEGETILVLGGVAAHRGYLDLFGVMLAAFAGGWLGDLTYFFLGRRHGGALLARFPGLQPRAEKVRRLVEKYPARIIVAMRFLYGLRTVGPMVIGMSTVPTGRFLALNAFGALLWAVVIAVAGYAFSNAVETLLPQIRHYEEYLFGAVLAAGVLVWTIGRVRRARTGGRR